MIFCHGWGQRQPRLQGHRSHSGQDSGKVWPGPRWLTVEGKKTLDENSLEELPRIPEACGEAKRAAPPAPCTP